MNRRSFLKAMAGAAATAFVVPELIVPERRVFALDQTMMTRNHARFLQWHIDRGIQIPRGHYTLSEPLIVRPTSKGIIMDNSVVDGDGADMLLIFQRPMTERDRLFSNVFRNSGWTPPPHISAGRGLLRFDASGVFDFGGSTFDMR